MKKIKIKSILVPTDFSEPSRAAVEVAKDLGRRWKSQLELIHVQEFAPLYAYPDIEIPAGLTDARAVDRLIDTRLKEAGKGYEKLRTHVLNGTARNIIRRLTADAAADLVVMGTHGHSALMQTIAASITESVVRASHAPVLAVHAGARSLRPRNILVPFNFTPHANAALAVAAAWAVEMGAKITLLYVIDNYSTQPVLANLAQERLRLTASDYPEVEIQRVLMTGPVEMSILEYAARGGPDFIVLSAHRRRIWKEWALGTTAERVLRHCPVPVLCVPSEERVSRRARRNAADSAHQLGELFDIGMI